MEGRYYEDLPLLRKEVCRWTSNKLVSNVLWLSHLRLKSPVKIKTNSPQKQSNLITKENNEQR